MKWRNEHQSRRGPAASLARRGFTLIELLLVMVILGILAGLVVPHFAKRPEEAKKTAAATDIRTIGELGIDTFQIQCGRYPTTEEGLAALVQDPGVKGWSGPYLKKGVPKDPWGNDYVYRYPATHGGDYDLYSSGPDGVPGNEDDIGNWVAGK